jgi:hypothetical protein
MNYSERHSRIVKHWFIIAVLGCTTPHTNAATAEVIEDFGSEIFQQTRFQILHHLTSGCLQLFDKHLKEIHVTCDDKLQAAMGKWF